MSAWVVCLLGLAAGFLGGIIASWLFRRVKPEEAVLSPDTIVLSEPLPGLEIRQGDVLQYRGRDGHLHSVPIVDPNSGVPEYDR